MAGNYFPPLHLPNALFRHSALNQTAPNLSKQFFTGELKTNLTNHSSPTGAYFLLQREILGLQFLVGGLVALHELGNHFEALASHFLSVAVEV